MHDLFENRTGALKGCMITLRAGEELVAAEFGPREAEAFHPWIIAYNPEMARYSPGMLLVVRLRSCPLMAPPLTILDQAQNIISLIFLPKPDMSPQALWVTVLDTFVAF